MNKLELIAMLKNECRISKKEAAIIVDLFFDSMSDALAKGDRVEIRGLCSFCVKEYKSYNGKKMFFQQHSIALKKDVNDSRV